MPAIKPKARTITVGNEEVCGTLQMTAQQYLTAEEREYISNALADRPTNDQIRADFAKSIFRGKQGYKEGDLIDYLADKSRLTNDLVDVIESSDALLKSVRSGAYNHYIGEVNSNALAEVKAFVELRVVNTEEMSADEVRNMSLKEFGTPGHFCYSLKLFDYIYRFYDCEQNHTLFSNGMIRAEGDTPFLMLHLPDEPIATPESDLASSTQNCTLPALDTEPKLVDTPSQELPNSSELQPEENESLTTNELPL